MLDRRVYFIRCETTGLVKIGVTDNPRKRLTELQIGNPGQLTLLGSMAGNRQTEIDLHERFAKHRVRGEWFQVTDDEVAELIEVETVSARMALLVHDGELWAPVEFSGIPFLVAMYDGLAMMSYGEGQYLKAKDIIAWHDDPSNNSEWDAEVLETARAAFAKYRRGELEVTAV